MRHEFVRGVAAAFLFLLALPAPVSHAGEKQAISLQSVMQNLETEMIVVQTSLWREDWAQVAAAADRMAALPQVSVTERERLKTRLAADFAKFVAGDQFMTETLSQLSRAAAKGDREAVLQSLSKLERGCVGCHRTFREKAKSGE